MPGPALTRTIIDSVNESGGSATVVSSPQRNPRRFVVQTDDDSLELWVYIWTVTHGGGRARPKNEYRIQLTGVQSPLDLNTTGGPTILVGYEPSLQCFAGFDLRRHRRFTPGSPSIQIPITTIEQALQDGLSFTRKSNAEVAVGVRPDQFLSYALNADLLHAQGADVSTVDLLQRAASLGAIEPEELGQLPQDRRRVVNTVSRLSRASNFRRKVLLAYDRRCAITRMQLRLVDAAHILPVGVRGSSDEVNNGISLSPTYHRAFDQGLIYLDDSLVMRINTAREQELLRIGLGGGIDDFKALLNRRIYLPADRGQWPTVEIIRRANGSRAIEI